MAKSKRSTMITANQLQTDISKLQKELDDLQDDCDHEETIVKQVPGGGVRKCCTICNRELGYPTQQETKNYLHGNKGSTRQD